MAIGASRDSFIEGVSLVGMTLNAIPPRATKSGSNWFHGARQEDDTHSPTRLLVIACGMIAREVLAVKEHNGLDHLDLDCLPAEFHYRPDRIAPAMDKAIAEARAEGYRHIFAGYADCGTGGLLDRVLEKHGVERMAGPHCFAFYQGNAGVRGDRRGRHDRRST